MLRLKLQLISQLIVSIVSRYTILYKYVGYGNILNAEEKEKEEKVHNADQGENPTAFHSATCTGQDTKKATSSMWRESWGEDKVEGETRIFNCVTQEKLQPTVIALMRYQGGGC